MATPCETAVTDEIGVAAGIVPIVGVVAVVPLRLLMLIWPDAGTPAATPYNTPSRLNALPYSVLMLPIEIDPVAGIGIYRLQRRKTDPSPKFNYIRLCVSLMASMPSL